jgi:hypothetical protein
MRLKPPAKEQSKPRKHEEAVVKKQARLIEEMTLKVGTVQGRDPPWIRQHPQQSVTSASKSTGMLPRAG